MEKYNKIVFWLKDKQLASNITFKLNNKRCFIINHIKTAFDCFNQKADMVKMIQNEEFPVSNTNIVRFADLVDLVLSEFKDSKKLLGVQVRFIFVPTCFFTFVCLV